MWTRKGHQPKKKGGEAGAEAIAHLLALLVPCLFCFYFLWLSTWIFNSFSTTKLIKLTHQSANIDSSSDNLYLHSVLTCSVVADSAIPWTVACQVPLSVQLSRQEYGSGLPFPSPGTAWTPLNYPALESLVNHLWPTCLWPPLHSLIKLHDSLPWSFLPIPILSDTDVVLGFL